MDTFDGDINHFSGGQGAGDEKLFIQFYMGTVSDAAATAEKGRPIFKDVECIRIITPGDKTNLVDRPMQPSDRARFARQYSTWKSRGKEGEIIEGTHLTEWPMISRSMAEELKYLHIRTVEQLAEVRDDVMLSVPGLATLKQNAQVWLGKTKTTAEAAKTTKLIEELQSQNAGLQQAVQDLIRKNEAIEAQMKNASKLAA
jgi:hypothetical protein